MKRLSKTILIIILAVIIFTAFAVLCACNQQTPILLVTVNADGGTVGEITVNDNGTLNPPAAEPTKEGYTFAGWYKDSSFKSKWNFETDKVTERVTLYAKWTANDLLGDEQELEFRLNSDGESYSVIGTGTVTDTNIVIPATYEGKPVTRISSHAFYGCVFLEGLTIPDSIIAVGDEAFGGCVNLRFNTYNMGAYLGNDANPYHIFVGARYRTLTALTVHKDAKVVCYNAFYGCNYIQSIVIPNGVVTIGEQAFYSCDALTSVILPNTVTEIGGRAFYGCSKLSSVNIPSNVQYLYINTFSYCTSLENITIPAGTIAISTGVFNNCTKLSEIKFSGTVDQWNSIQKYATWIYGCPAQKVICSNGEVTLK